MTLLLGPVLRHVSDTTALVWVQTDCAATVDVLGCSARTFAVQGHHYALVTVTGLTPDTVTEYDVKVDGELVWPLVNSPFPPSVIRTRGPASTHRLQAIFGSCRNPKTDDEKLDAKVGLDALDVYASRMAKHPIHDWPAALILLGDQLYADELTPETRRRLAGRRTRMNRHGQRPPDEVVSFAEYEKLYRHSWGDPEIRWLMSTVPTAMIFDDHDIRDDRTTSASWRADMKEKPWWCDPGTPSRTGVLLGVSTLRQYQPCRVGRRRGLSAPGDHRRRHVAASRRCRRPGRPRGGLQQGNQIQLSVGFRPQSAHHDRLQRNGRILDSGERMMIGEREFTWLETQATDGLDELDHLMLASSVPWLMPPAIGDLEAVNERNADRPGRRGRLAEKTRRAGDFEHWPAFYKSFLRLAEMIARVASHPDGPTTVSVLSGDVHHSYAARAEWEGDSAQSAGATVHQLVCSPVHNYVPLFVKPAFTLGWTRPAASLTRRRARRRGVPPLPLSWTNTCGPLFGNTIATLQVDGGTAEVLFEQPRGPVALDEVGRVQLSRPS